MKDVLDDLEMALDIKDPELRPIRLAHLLNTRSQEMRDAGIDVENLSRKVADKLRGGTTYGPAYNQQADQARAAGSPLQGAKTYSADDQVLQNPKGTGFFNRFQNAMNDTTLFPALNRAVFEGPQMASESIFGVPPSERKDLPPGTPTSEAIGLGAINQVNKVGAPLLPWLAAGAAMPVTGGASIPALMALHAGNAFSNWMGGERVQDENGKEHPISAYESLQSLNPAAAPFNSAKDILWDSKSLQEAKEKALDKLYSGEAGNAVVGTAATVHGFKSLAKAYRERVLKSNMDQATPNAPNTPALSGPDLTDPVVAEEIARNEKVASEKETKERTDKALQEARDSNPVWAAQRDVDAAKTGTFEEQRKAFEELEKAKKQVDDLAKILVKSGVDVDTLPQSDLTDAIRKKQQQQIQSEQQQEALKTNESEQDQSEKTLSKKTPSKKTLEENQQSGTDKQEISKVYKYLVEGGVPRASRKMAEDLVGQGFTYESLTKEVSTPTKPKPVLSKGLETETQPPKNKKPNPILTKGKKAVVQDTNSQPGVPGVTGSGTDEVQPRVTANDASGQKPGRNQKADGTGSRKARNSLGDGTGTREVNVTEEPNLLAATSKSVENASKAIDTVVNKTNKNKNKNKGTLSPKAIAAAAAVATGGAYSYLNQSDEGRDDEERDREEDRGSGTSLTLAATLIPLSNVLGLKSSIKKAFSPPETSVSDVNISTARQKMNSVFGSSIGHSGPLYKAGVPELAMEAGNKANHFVRNMVDYVMGQEHSSPKNFEALRNLIHDEGPLVWEYMNKTAQGLPVLSTESNAALKSPNLKTIIETRDRIKGVFKTVSDELGLSKEYHWPIQESSLSQKAKTLALDSKNPTRMGSSTFEEGSLKDPDNFKRVQNLQNPVDTLMQFADNVRNKITNESLIKPLSQAADKMRGSGNITGADSLNEMIGHTLNFSKDSVDRFFSMRTVEKMLNNKKNVQVGAKFKWDGSAGLPEGEFEVTKKNPSSSPSGESFEVSINGTKYDYRLSPEQISYMMLPESVRAETISHPARIFSVAARIMALKWLALNPTPFFSAISENSMRAISSKATEFSKKGMESFGNAQSDLAKFAQSVATDGDFHKEILAKMKDYELIENSLDRFNNETPSFAALDKFNDSKFSKALFANLHVPDFTSKLGILLNHLHLEDANSGAFKGGGILDAPESAWRKAALETYKTSDAAHRFLNTPIQRYTLYKMWNFLKNAQFRSLAHFAEVFHEGVVAKPRRPARLLKWMGTFTGLGLGIGKALNLDTDEQIDLFARMFPLGDFFIRVPVKAFGITSPSMFSKPNVFTAASSEFVTDSIAGIANIVGEAYQLGGMPRMRSMIPSTGAAKLSNIPEAASGIMKGIDDVSDGKPWDPGAAARRMFVTPSKRDYKKDSEWDGDKEKTQQLKAMKKKKREEENAEAQ